MIFETPTLRRAMWVWAILVLVNASAVAATLDFTLTTSKPVTVTGTPRLAIDVGGVTRYADYATGSGTNALTFRYAIQPRDFDANGIALVPPLDLNGGSLIDSLGNAASSLGFTPPDTSGVRIQTYTTGFLTSPVTSANASAVSFAIAKAPQGGSFSYTITSSGGAGSVAGSGTITSASETVTGVDVSGLLPGTLTLAVTVSTAAGGTGAPRQATVSFDGLPPSGYAVSFADTPVNAGNAANTGIAIAGGEVGSGYAYAITSSGGGTPVTGSGTLGADPESVTGLDLTGLADGTLTVSVTLTDSLGNAGTPVTATVTKDTLAPTILSVTPPAAGTYDDL